MIARRKKPEPETPSHFPETAQGRRIGKAANLESRWPADRVERRRLAEILPYARNPKTHSPEQVGRIAASIREFGWTNPVIIDEKGEIIGGHGRVLAAESLGLREVPCIVASGWTEAQKRAYRIADNALTESPWDQELLRFEIGELIALNFDVDLLGFPDLDLALAGLPAEAAPTMSKEEARVTLAQRFMVPPFSVLSARGGWWQERKAAWIALGIQSELGRGETEADASYKNQDKLTAIQRGRRKNAIPGGAPMPLDRAKDAKRRKVSPGGSPRPAANYSKRQRGDGAGRPIDG